MGNKDSGKLKCEMIKLDGSMIHKDGKITRSNFFDFLELPVGTQKDIQLTPDEAMRFRNHIVRMKIGTSAAVPMLCSGPKCPARHICPFTESKNWPLTLPCVVERELINTWTRTYIEELGIDPESSTSMVLINKLVECDIIDYRANIGLSGARDPEAMTLLKTTIIDTGNSISETVAVHPILEVKEKTHRMRQQILEALAATPREKYKRAAALKKTDDNADAAQYMSKMKATFEKIKRQSKENLEIKEIKEENSMIEDADWEDIITDPID